MEVHHQEEERSTELELGLGIGDHYVPKGREQERKENKSVPCLQLSFTLCPKQEEEEEEDEEEENYYKNKTNNSSSEENYYKNKTNNSSSDSSNRRKKLRLTNEQSAMLECTFKQHITLNPVQKHALAEQLNLTPRQVEVWFQNRRARTKLKQTEVDCEFWKKWCESLSDENKRLKKELEELKSQKK